MYNLANDVGEQQYLAAAQPQKAAELKTALKKWESQLAKPCWSYLRGEVVGELAEGDSVQYSMFSV